MMYQDEMARSGRRLFFVRGLYIYTIIAIGTVIVWHGDSYGPFADPAANRAWLWLSLGVAMLGATIRVVTSGYAALGTSGRAKVAAEASELNTTGPYSLVRNPLYVGRILNFTGLAMMTGSWIYGVIVFLLAILIYERISVYEEEFLRSKFGDSHVRWASSVPGLFPRLKGWVTPKYPFWWRRMLWREQNKLFLLVTAFVLYYLARRDFEMAAIPADHLPWLYAYAALVLIRFMIGGLKMQGYFRDLS
jgi:protein-S-isoprenylcysteine O-methyltransferase Ste14